MFKLVSVNNPEEVYTFIGGRKYTVGRKLADIPLANDTSVSRNHAEIEVDHPRANLENPSWLPTLNVTDVGSKFGTYVCTGNGNDLRQTNMRETESLVGGDRIRFGRQWNEFRVEYTPLVVTPSTLTREETDSLKDAVWKLGGHCARDWVPECGYVVMNAVTLTTKAVSALLGGKHIVTPEYFRDLLVSYETGTYVNITLDPKDFEPPFAEREISATNINLQPNPERAHLFEGKVFVVANAKQRKKIGATIAAGGGVCKLASECSPEALKSPDTLFIQPGPDVIIQEISSAINAYRSQKKRLISEPEISLAALYGSTAKHCNPFSNLADQIFPPMNTQTQTQNTPSRAQILVPETQSPLNKSAGDSRARNVVEESMNISLDAEAEFADQADQDVKPDTRVFHDARPGPSKRVKSSVQENGDLPSAKRRCEVKTELNFEHSNKDGHKNILQREKESGSKFVVESEIMEEIYSKSKGCFTQTDVNNELKCKTWVGTSYPCRAGKSDDIIVIDYSSGNKGYSYSPEEVSHIDYTTSGSLKNAKHTADLEGLSEPETVQKTGKQFRSSNFDTHSAGSSASSSSNAKVEDTQTYRPSIRCVTVDYVPLPSDDFQKDREEH